MPWSALLAVNKPQCTSRSFERRRCHRDLLLVHFLQQWFSLSDPTMEDALHDVPLSQDFAGLDGAVVHLPDETTILRFTTCLKSMIRGLMLGAVNEHLTSKGLMLRAATAVNYVDCGARFNHDAHLHRERSS